MDYRILAGTVIALTVVVVLVCKYRYMNIEPYGADVYYQMLQKYPANLQAQMNLVSAETEGTAINNMRLQRLREIFRNESVVIGTGGVPVETIHQQFVKPRNRGLGLVPAVNGFSMMSGEGPILFDSNQDNAPLILNANLMANCGVPGKGAYCPFQGKDSITSDPPIVKSVGELNGYNYSGDIACRGNCMTWMGGEFTSPEPYETIENSPDQDFTGD